MPPRRKKNETVLRARALRRTSQSFRVIRFAATDVMNDMAPVVAAILLACKR